MKTKMFGVIGLAAFTSWAGWNGAGVPGGTGGDAINDAANWAGGVIDGDFSGITTEGTTALVLTNNIAFAEGASKVMGLSFVSNSTDVVFTSVVGVAVGQTVNGTGIPYNTFLISLADTNGTISRATTGLPSGNYTFARPALNFNFGVLGTRATNVTVTVGSDAPGASRTLTLNGRLCQSSSALPTNRVVFSSDVSVAVVNPSAVTRESGLVNTGGILPQATFNGPLALGNYGAATTSFQLDGGDLTVNGAISGTNARLSVWGALYAGTLTLTSPSNSFSGGLTTQGGGSLVANSTTALAAGGNSSAVGSAGQFGLNNTRYTFTGFSTRQVCDRPWNIGGGQGSTIVNNGAAPIELTGTLRDDVSSFTVLLAGSYLNRGLPNVISGVMSNGTMVLGVNVQNGCWRLTNPNNLFTGSARVGTASGATLQFTSLANTGVRSALGAGSLLMYESAGSGGIANMEYVGTNNASCNRELRLTGNASEQGSSVLSVTGLGALDFTGGVTNSLNANAGGILTRAFVLGGTGTGVLSGKASLGDVTSGANTGRVSILKVGTGTWTISGTNFNHRGATTARAGTLNLDYTASDQIAAALPGSVITDGGTLRFVGKPSGVTSDAIGTFQFGANVGQYRSSQLVVDANGGDGFTLGIASLAGDGVNQKFELIDLSSSANNTVTVDAMGSKIFPVNNGVLMNNASSASDAAGRATLVLRTAAGYGFPVLSGVSNGVLQRLSGQPALPTSGYVSSANYIINAAGTVTPAANVAYSTLTIDTAAGEPTLALGANKLNTTSGGGRGTLLCGPSSATISGTGAAGHVSASSLWFHNYLDSGATFNASFNLAGDSTGPHILWGGPGFTSYTGLGLGKNFHQAGGVFRIATPQTLTFPSSGGIFVISAGGVFEIGADLNGAAAGDLAFAVGLPGATQTNIAFYGDSGLSAAGADRVVNFSGGGAALTWGSGHFLTYYDGAADYGYALKLSSAYADATIEIQNPVNLNGTSQYSRSRTVDVANGSAAVDARLSGTLSGNAALAKKGAGTLELTGLQAYDGPLMVLGGKVRFGAGNIVTNALTVQLRGGGLAAGGGSNSFGPLEIHADATIDLGDGTAPLAFASSSGIAWGGTLTLSGTLLANTLRFGTSDTGLSAAQLEATHIGADKVGITAEGYLYRRTSGTTILLQ